MCRFFEPPKWIPSPKLIDGWQGPSAGGCSNYDSFGNNPQWGIKLLTNTPTDIVINLIQADVRGVAGKKNFAIAVELYANKGNKCTVRFSKS